MEILNKDKPLDRTNRGKLRFLAYHVVQEMTEAGVGITQSEFEGGGRATRDLVIARQVFAYVAVRLASIPAVEVADYLDKHPSTITYYIQQAERIKFWGVGTKKASRVFKNIFEGVAARYISEYEQGVMDRIKQTLAQQHEEGTVP